MPAKSRVIFQNETIRVMYRSRNGTAHPEHIVATIHSESDPNPRGIKLSIDELFDLTEALDDVCDILEDEDDDET